MAALQRGQFERAALFFGCLRSDSHLLMANPSKDGNGFG